MLGTTDGKAAQASARHVERLSTRHLRGNRMLSPVEFRGVHQLAEKVAAGFWAKTWGAGADRSCGYRRSGLHGTRAVRTKKPGDKETWAVTDTRPAVGCTQWRFDRAAATTRPLRSCRV